MAANRHFGMGKESSWGTDASPTHFLELLSESLKVEKEFESIGTLRGYSISQVSELSSLVRGDTEFLANLEGMAVLFYALFGSATYDSGPPTKHTFPATAGIPAADRVGLSYTLEVARGGGTTPNRLTWHYLGCKPISMSLSAAVDAAARVTMGWVGKEETKDEAPGSASFPVLAPFKPKLIDLSIAGSSVCARNIEINVENPLDESFCLGATGLSKEPDRNDYLKVTGSAEVLFDDYAEYDLWANETDAIIIATIEESASRKTTFTMNKCRITSATPAISGRDRLAATYEWESFFDATATENLQVEVIAADADLTL